VDVCVNVCVAGQTGPIVCACAPGWTGPSCNIRNTCVWGTLLNSVPPKCLCNPGFSGPQCDIPIPEPITVRSGGGRGRGRSVAQHLASPRRLVRAGLCGPCVVLAPGALPLSPPPLPLPGFTRPHPLLICTQLLVPPSRVVPVSLRHSGGVDLGREHLQVPGRVDRGPLQRVGRLQVLPGCV
jgi:hypothetical protein